MKEKILKTIFLSMTFLACFNFCGPERRMDNDPDFTLGFESVFSYKGIPFTGIMVSNHPNGVRREAGYRDGLEDGRTVDFYPNGNLSAEYFFAKGKRVGIHKGWYENGNPGFWYEYKDGLSDGDHWEWHEEGNPYRYGKYIKDQNVGQKVWRKDGKIFSNYVYTKEKLYGVVGSKLCFKLKGDETNKKTVIY